VELDRLSRSLKDLIAILERIEKAQAKFQSITEHVETVSPAGRMLMQMLGSFAEFELAMIRERTKRGLEYARSQGRKGGRKPKLSPSQEETILNIVKSGEKSGAEAGRLFGVSKATVSRLVARRGGINKPSSPSVSWALRTIIVFNTVAAADINNVYCLHRINQFILVISRGYLREFDVVECSQARARPGVRA